MKKYIVVEAGSAKELEEKVTKMLNTGWKLQGGVQILMKGNWLYVQAMWRED